MATTGALPTHTHELPRVVPAAAVIDTSSHADVHVLPRRFLGPMPQNVVNSEGTLRRRQRMHDTRRKAMRKLLGTTDEDELLGIDEGVDERGVPGRRRKAVHRFRVRYRNLTDDMLREQDVDVNESDSPSDTSSDDEERGGFLWGGGKQKSPKKGGKKDKKKKKLHKDVWIGGSFDIGREFKTVAGHVAPDAGVTHEAAPDAEDPERPTIEEAVDDPKGAEKMAAAQLGDSGSKLQVATAGGSRPSSPEPSTPTRAATLFGPPLAEASSSRRGSRGSTLLSQSQSTSVRSGQSSGVETFVTAHSHSDNADDDASDTSSFIAHIPPPMPSGPQPQPSPPQGSHGGLRTASEGSLLQNYPSQASSSQALVAGSGTQPEPHRRTSKLAASLSGGSKRLRSAIRKNSGVPESGSTSRPKLTHSKTVQFPADPATILPPGDGVVRQGNKAPADPVAVLTRTAPEGTSADAQQQDILIDTDDFMPGGIVMRDRVLVKVGRHQADRLGAFDEAQQRRNPCFRLEDMEEYVVAMTMTSVDFYQDWVSGGAWKELTNSASTSRRS